MFLLFNPLPPVQIIIFNTCLLTVIQIEGIGAKPTYSAFQIVFCGFDSDLQCFACDLQFTQETRNWNLCAGEKDFELFLVYSEPRVPSLAFFSLMSLIPSHLGVDMTTQEWQTELSINFSLSWMVWRGWMVFMSWLPQVVQIWLILLYSGQDDWTSVCIVAFQIR